MSNFIWNIRQLLPLRYHSVYYTVDCDGELTVLNYARWRMWFGKVFSYANKTYQLCE